MSRLDRLPFALKAAIKERTLLKVISGLDNFDSSSVERIAIAAGQGRADLLDVACKPELVRLASEASGLPVCVSAVDPELFPLAVEAGAKIIEIGNYDSFYPKGRKFDALEVLDITRATRELLPEVVMSVTVPHTLTLDQQSELAIKLVNENADIIQTEGGVFARPVSPGNLGLIEKAAPTLAATYSITEALKFEQLSTPVICASGLSKVTAPLAIASGACGVGVGSVVNRLNDQLSMIAAVKGIREAIKKNIETKV